MSYEVVRRDSVQQDIRFTKTQVVGMGLVVVSLLCGVALGFALHDHSSAACIASCTATTAATFVLGCFLYHFGKHKSIDVELNWDKKVRIEKIQRYLLWTSLVLSIVFALNMGLAIDKGNIGCLAACTAITTTSLFVALCIAIHRRQKFHYKLTGHKSENGGPEPYQLLLINNGTKIQGDITITGTITQEMDTPLLKIRNDIARLEFINADIFKQIVNSHGMGKYVNDMWNHYQRSLNDKLAQFQTNPFFPAILKEGAPKLGEHITTFSLDRGCKFEEDDSLQVVEQLEMVTATSVRYVIRRRIFSKGNKTPIEDWSAPLREPVPSLVPYFK